jgi:hypothetical protein
VTGLEVVIPHFPIMVLLMTPHYAEYVKWHLKQRALHNGVS